MRTLSADGSFIRHMEAVSIVNKVKERSEHFYNERVSSRKPFGLATNVTPLENGNIILKYNKGKGAYNSKLITIGKEMVSQWKVIISYLTAEHAGQTDKEGRKKILSSLNILSPKEICTETYLVVDAFNTQEEAQNLHSYLRTRFVRFLIAQLAATQHLSKDKFSYVPLQDFTPHSDINWSQPVEDIDRQLYHKYALTPDEIAFIEKTIKAM